MICGSTDCEAEALVTALWPGQEIALCLRCADMSSRVAEFVGFVLHFTPLPSSAEVVDPLVEDWMRKDDRQ